ncbi:hypothetical protein [Terribacillus sp. 7520-G]|uniref:hypothetical protein n=1 Tax=Terribacillus sp. 7520-G TaxID=2025389 RepID=UPI000BA52CFC|nr:hypothetical protein [Terribacillus sp. 7520-G]PAD39845.1 hypothetical protein CHH53_03945 [Terribacillus sp. 7520-G]
MTEMLVKDFITTPIPGFPDYEADTLNGRVWSKRSNKWLSTTPNSNGYVYVYLSNKQTNVRRSYPLHRVIMASTFGDPNILYNFKETGIEVDHINENLKHVNGIHNLQLTTREGQYKRESVRAKMGKGKRLNKETAEKIIKEYYEWLKRGNNKKIDFIKKVCNEYSREYRSTYNLIYGRVYKELHNKYAPMKEKTLQS